MEFTQQNLNALGLGAGAGVLAATSIFGARSLAQCYANPICRLEVGTAIAEAAAGDALGTATLVPVVGVVAGKTVLKYGDEIVGLVDDATSVFRAVDASTASRLNAQLLSQEVANGHGFVKHIVEVGC